MPDTMAERFSIFDGLAKTAAASRANVPAKEFGVDDLKISPPTEVREGANFVTYKTATRRAQTTMSNMVFGNETAGKVYPGSPVWATALAVDGRLEPLFPMKRQQPYLVTVSDAIMKPGVSATFEYDGTFSDFTRVFALITSGIAKSQAVIDSTRSELQSVQAAMLQVGLNAKGWGASLAGSLQADRQSKKTAILVSLNQAYFTLTVEPKAGQRHFMPEMFDDSASSQFLIDEMRTKGEIGVIRRVTFGRRLLLSITSSSSRDQLNAAVKAGYKTAGASISAELTAEQKQIMSEAETRLNVLGGRPDPILVDNLVLPADVMLERVSSYLGSTVSPDELTSPAMTGFEVEYSYDRSPLLKLDTCQFDEQFQVSSRSAVGNMQDFVAPFSVGSDAATKLAGDTEIDTDDWTYSLVDYKLEVSPNKRSVIMKLRYDAREGNSNKTFGDTFFRIQKTLTVWSAPPTRFISNIMSPTAESKATWHKGGGLFGGQPVDDFGALRNIHVTFDAAGKKDLDVMQIDGEVAATVELMEI